MYKNAWLFMDSFGIIWKIISETIPTQQETLKNKSNIIFLNLKAARWYYYQTM